MPGADALVWLQYVSVLFVHNFRQNVWCIFGADFGAFLVHGAGGAAPPL